jgi:formyl-CoA transferase
LLKLMEREDLVNDPRFATPDLRARNHADIDVIVSEWTIKHDKREIMRMVGEAGIPGGAVFDTMELAQDPHMLRRKTMVQFKAPNGDDFTMPGNPIKMSSSEVDPQVAPALGSANDLVFGEMLELSAEEIAKLKEDKVI